jgi:hypothetical protein
MLQLTVRCWRAAGCSHEPSCTAGEHCAYSALVAIQRTPLTDAAKTMRRVPQGISETRIYRGAADEQRKVVTCLPVAGGSSEFLFTVDTISALCWPPRRQARSARFFATSAPPSCSMEVVSPLLILTIVQALVTRAPAASRVARRSIVRPSVRKAWSVYRATRLPGTIDIAHDT